MGNKAQDHEVQSLSLWLSICLIVIWNPLVWLLKVEAANEDE
jgi:bacteriorhodopsin